MTIKSIQKTNIWHYTTQKGDLIQGEQKKNYVVESVAFVLGVQDWENCHNIILQISSEVNGKLKGLKKKKKGSRAGGV